MKVGGDYQLCKNANQEVYYEGQTGKLKWYNEGDQTREFVWLHVTEKHDEKAFGYIKTSDKKVMKIVGNKILFDNYENMTEYIAKDYQLKIIFT